MTTWQDHDTPSGAAVTTWLYSANRGQLTSKEYNDGKGPSYTYTPGGRLLTRTWARLDGVSALVTTYDYDNAGQLIDIDYSDTTPDVEHTCNRRGQIAQTIDAAGTRVYTYNSAGQMLTEGYPAGIMEDTGIVNVYDAQLRRQSLTGKRDTTNKKTDFPKEAGLEWSG